jgi:tight adherence protein B
VTATWLAVLAAAAAALLLVRPPPRARGGARGAAWVPPLAGVGAVSVMATSSPGTAAPLLVAVPACVGVAALVRRRRRSRRTSRVAGRVLECCDAIAAELAAGQAPGAALHRAARTWPPLAPVAETHDLGGDVARALRQLAELGGAGDLRLLAAAWTVSHRTGQGLADAVRRCAEGLRADHATRRIVAGELASARSTARLMAFLPVAATVMGSGAGADPLRFLLTEPLGLVCLAAGLGCGLVGLWWLEVIADDIEAGA